MSVKIALKTSFSELDWLDFKKLLDSSNREFKRAYPGDSAERQPVHTVYGGAHLFSAGVVSKMGESALKTLNSYAPSGESLASALGEPYLRGGASGDLWSLVHERVTRKLMREPIEDFRIDFEDGYGNRPHSEEDEHAVQAAEEVALGLQKKILPPFIGIRIKALNEENCVRSLRTLDLFVTALLGKTGGKLPSGFVITLPKITLVEQAHVLNSALKRLEAIHHLPEKSLKFEIMVETPQAVINQEGRMPLRSFVEAGEGRCIGAHFGTYDYTAGCHITADHQTMSNPVCVFAKHVMQVSLAGLPVFLSDGATNVMPVGPHKEKGGVGLTPEQVEENKLSVHRAWKISFTHIGESMRTGFYQGWDLHPAQLPIRYAATYYFYLSGLTGATQRLKGFVEKAAKATLLGDVFDDAATGQGLLNYFLTGLSCGALSEEEVRATGLSLEEIQSRSFLKILEGRQK